MMKKQDWKQVLMSILIGACVAFITSLLDNTLLFLQGLGNDVIAGGSSAIYWIAKNIKV